MKPVDLNIIDIRTNVPSEFMNGDGDLIWDTFFIDFRSFTMSLPSTDRMFGPFLIQ